MEQMFITGGRRLAGELKVQGAKNSILPILAATVLNGGESVIHNCPRLSDVEAGCRILRHLGCRAQWQGDNTLAVDTAGMNRCDIPEELMRAMRSSIIFLGAILSRCGEAVVSCPGGCELGPRPIDLHLRALKKLGVEISEEKGDLHCRCGKMKAAELVFGIPSVGATENAILAACGAEGTTLILNAAREPEIVDLQVFLNAMGARVRGAGTSTVTVEGGGRLCDCSHRVMPDRIVSATYLCAAAGCGGDVLLKDCDYRHVSSVLSLLEEAGCRVKSESSRVRLISSGALSAVRPVHTAPYPGFPTDAQAVLMAALLRSRGVTVFVENIFKNRYRHVDELCRMGAEISLAGKAAVVYGVGSLCGAPVRCTDLRGGAALAVAALQAEGESVIAELQHIDRGYEDIARDLTILGARVRRQ